MGKRKKVKTLNICTACTYIFIILGIYALTFLKGGREGVYENF